MESICGLSLRRERPEIGGAQRAHGGARRAAARGRTITGNENLQMLTEKQVKLVRFYRLYCGRKNGTELTRILKSVKCALCSSTLVEASR